MILQCRTDSAQVPVADSTVHSSRIIAVGAHLVEWAQLMQFLHQLPRRLDSVLDATERRLVQLTGVVGVQGRTQR